MSHLRRDNVSASNPSPTLSPVEGPLLCTEDPAQDAIRLAQVALSTNAKSGQLRMISELRSVGLHSLFELGLATKNSWTRFEPAGDSAEFDG